MTDEELRRMENEEIYKYADKKLKKRESRILLKYFGIVLVWIIGAELMVYPIGHGLSDIGLIVALFVLVSFLIVLILFLKGLDDVWFKPRRNYIYNLVREDERKRLNAIQKPIQ